MNRLGTPLAFGLCEYQFTHYGFFGRTANIVHQLHPPHLIGRLELFVDALSLSKLYGQSVQQFVCLFVHISKVGIEPSFTEQGGVPSATMLLEVVAVHPSVFADWLLFGKLHVGNEVVVFLAVCIRRVELSPSKANFGTKSATPFCILRPSQPSDSDFFIAIVKPLVSKGFATFYL